jgi:hypothetical protein
MNNLRGAFRIMQVVSGQTTTDFTRASSSYGDWTNVTATITPSDTNSKVLVVCNSSGAFNNGGGGDVTYLQVIRGASTVVGEESFGSIAANPSGGWPGGTNVVMWIDSPATTSATTYKAQVRSTNAYSITWRAGALLLMEVSA